MDNEMEIETGFIEGLVGIVAYLKGQGCADNRVVRRLIVGIISIFGPSSGWGLGEVNFAFQTWKCQKQRSWGQKHS